MTPVQPLLRATALVKTYQTRRSPLRRPSPPVVAVDQVTFDVWPGETLGLVGESGCGKSTLGRCLLRLTDISAGTLEFEGRDITKASLHALRPTRRRMQMVFQDPYASLNPRRRVGDLLAEPLRVHKLGTERQIADRVAELLTQVDLRPDHAQRYPHEFSGGQRQRIGIARALALEPRLIVADEPVSALDVSVQAQVINLMTDLRERLGLTYVFIAHDLSVVRHISSRVAVMYLGAIVEIGATDDIFGSPHHPYTQALLSAVPVTDPDRSKRRQRILLEGEIPNPSHRPSGCRFHSRCPYADDQCRAVSPPLAAAERGRLVACHKPL
ncbi:ABC transporter ATP-binding protein [Rhodospirillum rubrum]|uniref:Oligopeptide/dipeptide ABC transporter, ATP-binding protein-like n=1 Tax=Rhodospirillum rubrum (strain ATCC 11170 / ATH 1.1.1 / DSM 467 / LMG 4362 / NCIMB 8255 / S1) TaxID=269796 RepID=Q2RSC1_RHORT|nr:dipeptide ABC transporter ATP-binding protein [Rhodospirillum rubrum]ABC22974.1 Oligopeptide/dipeptide ABC transporter, ATP-binding protein-like [Rhodospirillum rubrum ATCC 11170]AEO48704.1 oligopeptide/dipeptide ABC transporter ATP-binding protein-like protein [Rhodospirillum rubrum F11]MBK5954599.1 ABC transporter ATP-binding protein [Rhodospirillum rubrum]QXG78960.1 dipeptide ABC transporter ATP-binding protein [Rhodospirillum rubrum]HAP98752.1 ABC transporter ATP-binding protein [Rhodos